VPDIDKLTELIAEPWQLPLTGIALRAAVEAFPEYFRAWAQRLRELADLTGEESPGLAETAALIGQMAECQQTATDAAEQAALEFAEQARFWSSDGQ
jgi:hypothetical protein